MNKMNITIKSLTVRAYCSMVTDCGMKLFDEVGDTSFGVRDVTINESATMKVYDDVIFFNLRGNLTSLHRQDFHEITIT